MTLTEFCRDQHPQLVGGMGSYCGDRQLAEDVAQEALLRASEHWDDVREMDAPGAWVYRVAVNLTNSRYRRRRIEQRVLQELTARGPFDDWWQDPGDRVALERALATLPARQRAAVALRYLLDWSVADVADALDASPSAVRSLTHRGLTALREHFDDVETPSRSNRSGLMAVIVLLVAAVGLGTISEMWGAGPSTIEVVSDPDPTQPCPEGAAPVNPGTLAALAASGSLLAGCSGVEDPIAVPDDPGARVHIEGYEVDDDMVLTEGTFKHLQPTERLEVVLANDKDGKVVLLAPRAGAEQAGSFTVMVELDTELLGAYWDNRRFLASDGECVVAITESTSEEIAGTIDCGHFQGMRGTFLSSVEGAFRARQADQG